MRELKHAIGSFLAAFLVLSGIALAQEKAEGCAGKLNGAWKDVDGDSQLLFEDDQIVILQGGSLRIAKILGKEPCRLIVRDQGLRSTWKLQFEKDLLRLDGAGALNLRSLSAIPAELDVNMPIIPEPQPISPEQAKQAAAELLKRAQHDQATLKDPSLRTTWPKVFADNLGFLRDLTRNVGWIDIPRFGKDAAASAILIADHGDDLMLMKAALPIIERDVREHGGSGEMYSVLYDELAVVSGNKQRYGTQIGEDSSGLPFVLPVEDPSRVDAFRKEIGILSWKQYLALASENFYGGAPIRVAGSAE
jgi:hypothetical protein